jgi:hypothetical protein
MGSPPLDGDALDDLPSNHDLLGRRQRPQFGHQDRTMTAMIRERLMLLLVAVFFALSN